MLLAPFTDLIAKIILAAPKQQEKATQTDDVIEITEVPDTTDAGTQTELTNEPSPSEKTKKKKKCKGLMDFLSKFR